MSQLYSGLKNDTMAVKHNYSSKIGYEYYQIAGSSLIFIWMKILKINELKSQIQMISITKQTEDLDQNSTHSV